jgi:hypothetical protein
LSSSGGFHGEGKLKLSLAQVLLAAFVGCCAVSRHAIHIDICSGAADQADKDFEVLAKPL